MSQKRFRAVMDPITITEGDLGPVSAAAFRVVEEWVPEQPTERWTDWRQVETVEDRDPTYFAGVVRPYRLGGIVETYTPHRRVTTTFERKLIRTWTDRVHGPMAETVETETRTVRA